MSPPHSAKTEGVQIPSKVWKFAAVGAMSIGLTLATTSNASAAAYDGQDPISSGCSSTDITAASTAIYLNGSQVGTLELRYSTGCRIVWGRVISQGNWGDAAVRRSSDNAYQGCGMTLGGSSTLGAYSCYTPMLNDAGVTSCASGSASESSGHTLSNSHCTTSY